MRWNPSGKPGSSPVCAMRRTAVSPAQRAEMRGDISGSDALPESERTVRENSMAENQWPCPDARGGALGDPRDKAKVGLPLRVPPDVIKAKCAPYRRHGKPWHRPAMQNLDDYDIIQAYGAEYRG